MVTITRSPRTSIVLRTNECLNPRMGSTYGWLSSGSGTSSPAATDSYDSNSGMLNKYWNNGAPSDVGGAGWYTNFTDWAAGMTKIVSGYIYYQNWQPKMRVQFFFYNSSNQRIGQSDGGAQQLLFNTGVNTGEDRIWHSATAPTGTVRTEAQLSAVTGNNPPQGQGMGLRRVLKEPGTTLSSYFDGNTYANGNGSQFTVWTGTADQSTSELRDANPLDVTTPFVDGWDEARPTGNSFIDLIDGGTAAVLVPSGPRRGTLKLLYGGAGVDPYDARLAARRAMDLFAAGARYIYQDLATSDFGGMTFVVAGDVRATPWPSRRTWQLDVPYREL